MAMLDAKCTINLIFDIIDDTRNELMYLLIDLLESWFLFIFLAIEASQLVSVLLLMVSSEPD